MVFGRKLLAIFCVFSLLSASVRADIGVGDCVVFREGGEGRLLKSPTFWVKGVVGETRRERVPLRDCPATAGAGSAVARDALWQLARSAPCVLDRADNNPTEIDVTWVRVVVDAWETPWTAAHGDIGLLYRGTYIGQPLVKGGVIEMLADWLKSCAGQP